MPTHTKLCHIQWPISFWFLQVSYMTKVFEKIERRGGVLKIVFELSSSFSFIRPTFNEGAKQAWLLFFNQIINMSIVQQCMFCKVHIIGNSADYMHFVTYIIVYQNTLILKKKRETSLLWHYCTVFWSKKWDFNLPYIVFQQHE